ncbi:MAG: hypothetical protein R3F56_18915 [Planctomycetota bacterium]
MPTAVNLCAGVCTLLLAVWVVLQLAPPRPRFAIDRLGAACYLALGVTSIVTFRMLVVAPPEQRGPLPVFVFLGAPMGLVLAWLSWRLPRSV